MAILDLDDTGQPMDPRLAMAVEAAFRAVSLTAVTFVPAPRAWRKSNPAGSVSGPKHGRKADIKLQLAERDGFRCAYCARGFVDFDDATLDHVIPNSIVGHWQPWNLLLACEACNTLKADRIPLVLMPLLCALLQGLLPVARLAHAAKAAAAGERKARKAANRARTQAEQRQALVRKQLEALAGHPIRLALEAGTGGTR